MRDGITKNQICDENYKEYQLKYGKSLRIR